MYTYEAWIGLTGQRLTLKSTRLLDHGDFVFPYGEKGEKFYVAYVLDREVPTVVVAADRQYCGHRRDGLGKPETAASRSLMHDLEVCCTGLPKEYRALFQRQLQRLVDHYRPFGTSAH